MRRLLRLKHLIRGAIALALVTGLVLFSMAVPVPTSQGPKDPADLLPTSTLCYLEFSQPQPVVQELGALLKGSSLEDMPAFLAQLRDKRGDEMPFWMSESYSMLGTFLGPEGLAEAGRLKAGCVALTGFDKNHAPEFLWVLLSGESNLPGLVMRAILTENRNIRSVEKVGGVGLYQELNWRNRFGDKDKDKGGRIIREEPESKYSGPTYALMPGMLVIGSNQATVRDAVLRARGMKAEPSLSQSAGFQRTAKLRERPGVFAYADLGFLASQAEKFLKDAPRDARFGFDSFWNFTRVLANPKGLRTVAASLTLQKSGLDLQAQLHFDPNQDIPVLALLPDKPVQPDVLHFAPANSLAAVTVSVSDGAKQWEQLLALADALFRESGERGDAPSKIIEGLHDKFKVHFGKDVLGKITGVNLVVGTPAEPGQPSPLLVLKTANPEAAKSLETVLLEAIRLIDDDKTLLPTSHEIQDRQIRSFPGTGPRPPIHQGLQGSILVLGLSAKTVADALVAGTKKQGLLAQPRVAESLKALDEPLIVGVGSLNRTVLTAMMALNAPGAREVGQHREALEKLVRVLAQSTEEMPPAVLSLTRKPGVLNLTLHQNGLQAVSAQTVDALMEWNLRRRIGEEFPFRKDFGIKDRPPFREKDKDGKNIFKDKDKDKDKDGKDKDKDKDKR